ncbi:MAG TPA: glucosylceramidase, partial [Polyangiaceae bacterium]|nr:glucosylceramidase [Polyangiaceae bacterium]
SAGEDTQRLPTLVTSAAGAYWKTDEALTEVVTGAADVTVNDIALQSWEGFGGAFNERGWTYLAPLSESDRKRAMELLFGAEGAHFNLGRIPIGASDYALDSYTLNETPNDAAMAHFTISRDLQILIPYVKAALAVRPDIRFWASPWTPPTWMKRTSQTLPVPSPFDGGSIKGDAATLQSYAQYFVKFVRAYAAQGITIDAVAPQNEPTNGQNQPACLWDNATFVSFIGDHLGPAFEAAGLDTQIMLGTMSHGTYDAAVMNAVLANPTASSYVKMIGLQWSMLDNMATARATGLPMWQTEHICGNCPFSERRCATITQASDQSGAPNDHRYAIESWHNIHEWINAGVSAYNAWNMVLDQRGLSINKKQLWEQNALLVVDTSARTLTITPAYYVFRHLSQYVEPGAKVMATSGGSALAFKNPGGAVVTVMFNAGAARTSVVSVLGRMFSFAMPESGWATIVAE